MQGPIVRVICAIGQSGQMGLKGRLPWEGNRSPVFTADAARFFDITRGHVLLAGPRTIGSIPEFARGKRFARRVVFIGGGPAIWNAYARFISHWDITRLPYDGPADRWFDPGWITAGGLVSRQEPVCRSR